jgi:protein-disulfide isomerase
MINMKRDWTKFLVYGVSAILLILILIILFNYFNNKHEQKTQSIKLEEHPLDIVFGSDSAALTVYMYSSYSCTFCTKFFKEVYPDLKYEFFDAGKVKLIMRLTVKTNNIDLKNALKTVVCIHKFGYFNHLHNLLLENSKVVYTQDFRDMIDDFISRDIFVAECILGEEVEAYLLQNLNEFDMLGLKGTPTFIIDNKVYIGYRDYDQFKQILNDHINND